MVGWSCCWIYGAVAVQSAIVAFFLCCCMCGDQRINLNSRGIIHLRPFEGASLAAAAVGKCTFLLRRLLLSPPADADAACLLACLLAALTYCCNCICKRLHRLGSSLRWRISDLRLACNVDSLVFCFLSLGGCLMPPSACC